MNMKIPLLYIPNTNIKKILHIEKKYQSPLPIIPIGADCSPAYCLQKLNLRSTSLPFDWLNTDPIKGLNFVKDNIKNNFSLFLAGLNKNDAGNIISSKYSYAEFLHEPNLIQSNDDQQKFYRRIEKFTTLYKKDVNFIYNIPSTSLDTRQVAEDFIRSVHEFKEVLKKNDKLYIYIRYDESYDENRLNCEKVNNAFNDSLNINIKKHIREIEAFGIWGNEKEYPELLRKLGIAIKLSLPRVYIS